MTAEGSQERIAELERELEAQKKVNRVLMERVERSVDSGGEAHSLFERNLVLQQHVERRTRELEESKEGLRRAKEEADAKEAYYRSIIDNTNEGFVLHEYGDNRIKDLNTTLERMVGRSREEILGRPIFDFVPADFREYLGYQARERATDEHGHRKYELVLEHRDGTRIPVQVNATTFFDEEGQPTIAYGFLTDLTEQKGLEEELREASRRAEEANQAKSMFLANMSHELRTPLNAVIGYSEMLLEEARDDGDDALESDLQRIHSAGEHLLSMINDILDLSKIEAGKVELYFEDFDLCAMFEEVESTIQPLVAKRSNKLEVDCPPSVGTVRTDRTRLRQILFNLLSNAAKFTDQGTVVLRARRTGRQLEFSVADTGTGMSEDQLEHLFEAFTQADASTTRNYGGTGLGLTITRHFTQMLGGEIDVTSREGEGSTFTVRLPEVPPEGPSGGSGVADQEATAESGGGVGSDHGAPLILVVDDDADARQLLTRSLEQQGYRTATASDGERALERARELGPDAITLDVMMPGMDGWAVLTQLKADEELSTIPVVMVTIVEQQDMGYALRVTDYLTKPVQAGELVETLHRHGIEPGPRRLLVVEDDADTRALVERSLSGEQWEVHSAAHGREALAILPEARPELILLDLMMPEMDGFEFLDRLRADGQWAQVPVLVMTAKELSEADRRHLNGSVERVIRKGGQTGQSLLQEVSEAVGRAAAAASPERSQC